MVERLPAARRRGELLDNNRALVAANLRPWHDPLHRHRGAIALRQGVDDATGKACASGSCRQSSDNEKGDEWLSDTGIHDYFLT